MSGNVRDVSRNPRVLPTLIRKWLGRMWRRRGGGYYGVGYVVTFLVLEIRMLLGDWQDSKGIVEFLGQQLLELIFRFFIESFINSFIALAWPFLLISKLQLWGLALLIVGYFVFERLLKPSLERLILKTTDDTDD